MPQVSIFLAKNESQPMSTIHNDSQREMPVLALMRSAVDAPVEFVQRCRNEIDAINLCINLSGLSDEAIYTELSIDKGHFSRLRKGRGNFPSNKRLALMAVCGNRAPVQFEALRLNCDLVDKTKDQQIKELEVQLAQLRRAA
jgi:hypothetical protein